MASMNAWPSVSIKRGGLPVISHKIKCEWTDTLGAIVEKVDPSLSHKKSATLTAFFFSNRPTTDPELLSGMPVKQLLQLKWP